jgi:predicted DNA-binding WGR domain protein
MTKELDVHEDGAVELRQIDPARRRFRRYRITECRSLFGEPCLIIEWGGIGRRGRLRSETFESPSALGHRKRQLLARRRRHGYVSR